MSYQPKNPNGQTAMANSEPVVIASNQTAIPVSGTVVTGGITDTQIRATPLPVTMSNTLALTDTQLRASPVPVSNPVLSGSGSLTAAAQAVTLVLGGRYANTTFQVSGTYVGTLVFEASNDGFTTNSTINALRAGDNTISQQISDSASNDIYRCTTAGFNAVRLRANVFTSGTAVITALATESTSGVFLNFPIPAGLNTIGAVNINGTVPVNGTFFQATQPVSLAANTPVIAAGTASIGNINELRASTLAVTGTAASGTAVTITLPAVAAAFHYITAIDIVLYSAAARTGAAAPTVVTTTNLPGAVAFTFSTAGAIGTTDVQDLIRVTPLKSSTVNTATTIVAPIAAGGIWRITVTYFTGA